MRETFRPETPIALEYCHRRVQFILANGWHGSQLLLALATVLGVGSYEYYAEQACLGFQPDSPEEQERRTQVAYIRLYGDVTRDRH